MIGEIEGGKVHVRVFQFEFVFLYAFGGGSGCHVAEVISTIVTI